MTTSKTNLMTRAELSQTVGLSERQIIAKQKEWGLREIRINARVIRYPREDTMKILKEKKLI